MVMREKNKSMRGEMRREDNWLTTLFKKAHELSVLTDCKVAIILNSSRGELHQFVSADSSMQDILERYQKDIPQKVQTAGIPLQESNGMPPKEDQNDIPSLEDSPSQTPDDMPYENLQHLKLSKSDMHKVVDSYTDEEIEQFEQQLKQAMIKLLQRKVKMVEEQVQDKREKEMSFAAANTQLHKEMEIKQREMCCLLREEVNTPLFFLHPQLQEVLAAQCMQLFEESPSGARDSQEIRFDVGSSGRIMEVGSSSSSGTKESEEVEMQDMELDLELCLGLSRRRSKYYPKS